MKPKATGCLLAVPRQALPAAAPVFPGLASHSRRQWLQWAGAGALAHVLAGCGGSGDDTPDAGQLADAIQWGREAILRALETTDTTAISVALMTRSGVVWQEAFGLADTESALAATTETRFNIGSVSKVVAALAAMILCDRGQLALDASLTRYLPDFAMLSDEYRQMTLRHLLSHSSGLPGTNWRNVFAFAPIAGYARDTQEGVAHYHLKHLPGELAVYCNDGFTMVENLVEAVTGLSFPEFVQREILQPLGMRASAYSVRAFAEGSFAHPVYQGRRQAQEFVAAYATGGLASTPGDMMKLASMILNQGEYQGRRIVSRAAIQEMAKDQTTGLRINPCPEWRWGLGWDNVRQFGMDAVGVKTWQKNGGTAFFSTEFAVLPDQHMALLLTGAGTRYGPLRITEGVLLRALQATRVIPALPAVLPDTAPAASPSGNASSLEGVYASAEAPLKVQAADARTVNILQWESGAWQPLAQGLTRRTDGWWWGEAPAGVSYRWETVEGRHYLITRMPTGAGHYRISMPLGQRLAPSSTPLPAVWQRHMGSRWQPTNESPDSVAMHLGDGVVTLDALPDLPGYVLWDGRQLLWPKGDGRAEMTVRIPVTRGRDLVEAQVRTINGEDQLRVGSALFRPLPG